MLMAQMKHPYAVALLDHNGVLLWRVWPLTSTVRPPNGALVSLSAIPLGCNRYLQILVNLRNDERLFVVYAGASPVLIKRREVLAPIGLVQAVPGSQSLLGYDDTPQRRGVVVYGWKWR
jgi:hypothetical protein